MGLIYTSILSWTFPTFMNTQVSKGKGKVTKLCVCVCRHELAHESSAIRQMVTTVGYLLRTISTLYI